MATINDIKNSVWANTFLAKQGVSLDELDSLKDTSALILAFEEFMLEKYEDPEISTPEQEEKAESPEVKERLEEINNSKLKYKSAGYPLKGLNEDFEELAYQSAIRSLALSEDEITQENLERHIESQSNRIATEYYSGIWAAQQPEKKLNGHTTEHYANVVEKINQMVEQKQGKEQVYQNLFGEKNRPSAQTEKNVTTLVINTNTVPISDWLKKMGETGAKFLDKMQKLEQDHPLASLAANLAVGSVASPALMAYRMSLASRNIYKMSKESGMSVGQMLKDKEKRKQLLNQGKAFARIVPGAGIFLSADALKNHFKKEGRKGLAKTLTNTGNAIKTLWQTKGRDKQAWKDLGKGAATVGGLALTIAAAARGLDALNNANEAPINDDTANTPPASNNEVTLDGATKSENYVDLPQDYDNASENIIETTEQTTEQQSVDAHQEEFNRLPENLSFDAGQELSPEQQDLRNLLLREPAMVNSMLNDGEFHSSAELRDMWNNGEINNDVKLELLKYAEGRFNDNGNFLDSNGNIDMEAENSAQNWQAQQSAKANAEEVKTRNEDLAPLPEVSAENIQAQAEMINDNNGLATAPQESTLDDASAKQTWKDHEENNELMVNVSNEHAVDSIYGSFSYQITDDGKVITEGANIVNEARVSNHLYENMGAYELRDGSVRFGEDGPVFDAEYVQNAMKEEGSVYTAVAKNLIKDYLVAEDIKIRMDAGENVSEAEAGFLKNYKEYASQFEPKEYDENGNLRSRITISGDRVDYDKEGNVIDRSEQQNNKTDIDQKWQEHQERNEQKWREHQERNEQKWQEHQERNEQKWQEHQERKEQMMQEHKNNVERIKQERENNVERIKQEHENNVERMKQSELQGEDVRSLYGGAVKYKISDANEGSGFNIKSSSNGIIANQQMVDHIKEQMLEDGNLKPTSSDFYNEGMASMEAGNVLTNDIIYNDLASRQSNGETLSSAELSFMKYQEAVRESYTDTEYYKNGQVKSETDYKGNETEYNRDGSIKSHNGYNLKDLEKEEAREQRQEVREQRQEERAETREQRQEERWEAKEQRQEAREQRQEERWEAREQRQEARQEAREERQEDNTDKNNSSQSIDEKGIKKHYEDLVKQGKTSEAMEYLQELSGKANQDLSSVMDRAHEYNDYVMNMARAYRQDTMDMLHDYKESTSETMEQVRNLNEETMERVREFNNNTMDRVAALRQEIMGSNEGTEGNGNGNGSENGRAEHIKNLRGLGDDNKSASQSLKWVRVKAERSPVRPLVTNEK